MLSDIQQEGSASWWVAVITFLSSPIVTVLMRYIWNLASVQTWVKKQTHGAVLDQVVQMGIAKAEAIAKNREPGTKGPSGFDKLAVAAKFVEEQGLALRLPSTMLQPDVIKASIEKNLTLQEKPDAKSNGTSTGSLGGSQR